MPRVTYDTDHSVTLSTEGDYLRVGFNRDRNVITEFRVQYETTIAGRVHPVIRCDCAHGFPHCDLLDHEGRTIEKIRLPENQPLKQVFDEVVARLRANWRTYRAEFLDRERQP
jgi:hypothetical protein